VVQQGERVQTVRVEINTEQSGRLFVTMKDNPYRDGSSGKLLDDENCATP